MKKLTIRNLILVGTILLTHFAVFKLYPPD